MQGLQIEDVSCRGRRCAGIPATSARVRGEFARSRRRDLSRSWPLDRAVCMNRSGRRSRHGGRQQKYHMPDQLKAYFA